MRSVGQRDDRLVVQPQLVAVDRTAQVVLDPQPGDRPVAHRLVEQLVAGPPALLGPVHRGVGVADQLLGALAAAGERDADAGGDEVLVAGEHERAGEHRRDPLGHLDRVVLAADVLEQHPELVAAEPGDGVACAHRLLQPRRDGGEQLVADVVAEAVVDQLEVVEVEEQDRGHERLRRAAERVLEPVEEQHAVRQAGERVVERAVADLVLGGLALERVGEHVGQRLDEVEVAGGNCRRADRLDAEHAERAAGSLDRDVRRCVQPSSRSSGDCEALLGASPRRPPVRRSGSCSRPATVPAGPRRIPTAVPV